MNDKFTIKNDVHQIPAGLLMGDKRTELFGCKETKRTFFITDGKTYNFKELKGELKAQIFTELLNDDAAIEDLKNLSQEDAIEKFAFCNYGAADHEPDFCENGTLKKPDNFICSNNCMCLKWKSKKITIDGVALTPREFEIITMMASDLADKQIADKLKISESTLNTHKSNLFHKANVLSKVGLITKAVQQKIIQ
jgi:DNA-binding CsgD family transcriptional regulator